MRRPASLHASTAARSSEPKTAARAEIRLAPSATPLVIVVTGAEPNLGQSFRNLERTHVVDVAELEVADLVWARSLVVSKAALAALEGGEAE